MLPPFIIEQIRQREEEVADKELRPRLQLPVPDRAHRPAPPRPEDAPLEPEEGDRGVVVIDLMG